MDTLGLHHGGELIGDAESGAATVDGRDGGDARRKQGQAPSPAVGAIREKSRIAIRDKIR